MIFAELLWLIFFKNPNKLANYFCPPPSLDPPARLQNEWRLDVFRSHSLRPNPDFKTRKKPAKNIRKEVIFRNKLCRMVGIRGLLIAHFIRECLLIIRPEGCEDKMCKMYIFANLCECNLRVSSVKRNGFA